MFKISEFSRFTRVSVKMLRHYDELGLLRPAHIDPLNNYRYYSAEQLPRLNRIIALKDLGFSLNEISKLLESGHPDEEITGMFRLRKAEIQQKINEETRRMLELESRMRMMNMSNDGLGHDIILRSVPGQWIASIRSRIGAEESLAPLFDEVETYVASHRARAEASPLAIYHDEEYEQEESDVEVAVPIESPIRAGGRVAVRELPTEPAVACITYSGSYSQNTELLNALLLWIERHGHQITGALREVYRRFDAGELEHLGLPQSFLTDDEDEFVTELQIPVSSDAQFGSET
jgi:DNA-binding transcriptional MerR regulator